MNVNRNAVHNREVAEFADAHQRAAILRVLRKNAEDAYQAYGWSGENQGRLAQVITLLEQAERDNLDSIADHGNYLLDLPARWEG